MTSEGNLLRFIRFGEVSSLMVHFLNLNLPPLGKMAEKFLLCYSNSKGVMIDVMDVVWIIYSYHSSKKFPNLNFPPNQKKLLQKP